MVQALFQIKTEEQFNFIEKLPMGVPLAVLKFTQKWDSAFSYFSQNKPRKMYHLNKPNSRLNYTKETNL